MNNDCLTENFPGVMLTELQISPTGADGVAPSDQCLPCILENAQTNDSDTTATYCDPSTSFFAFDFTDSAATPTPVTDDATVTTNLFFKIGYCGTLPMTISADGTKAKFTTLIGKPVTVYNNSIITEPTLLATEITCSYQRTITDLSMSFTVATEVQADTDKDIIIT